MTEAEELDQISTEIERLGGLIEAHKHRAVQILKGRKATRTGGRRKFLITGAKIYFGHGCRIFFYGPALKADGTAHSRNQETASLQLIEKIEK